MHATIDSCTVSTQERERIRSLAQEYAAAANESVASRTADLWRRLNSLQSTRPLIYIDEQPWEELTTHDSTGLLRTQCEHPFIREYEGRLVRQLYMWKHARGDLVLDPVLYVPLVGGPSSCYADYGIVEDVSHGASHAFHRIIKHVDDLGKIKRPKVWVDWDSTEQQRSFLDEMIGDILPVQTRGIVHQWATPWDVMVRWYGIEDLLVDMYDDPDLIHALLAHYMKIQHDILDEQERLGMLSAGGVNVRVGSGGLGITDELPPVEAGTTATAAHQWGCGNAQIFSEVSPAMHEEFSLNYERPYMERFGLSYYGCCEPLHHKIDLLKTIGNLRKISITPWANLETAAEEIGTDYVISYKFNPSYLAGEDWDPSVAREKLQKDLRILNGCHVEVILKDITTVRQQPQRLWEWAQMAADEVARCG